MTCFVALAVLIFTISLTFQYIYNEQPDPYMDEVFHVPQARQFCSGNFSNWNPMITTLPGLYLVSVGLLVPVGKALGVEDVCSVLLLRTVNTLFAVGNFYVLYAIMCKLHEKSQVKIKFAISALTLSFLPLLYFFNFLYYTDAGSTFFVLFMYLLHLHDNKFLASIVGLIAVMFRQTNIIWTVFVAGLTARKKLIDWIKLEDSNQYERRSKEDLQNNDDNVAISKILKIVINSLRKDMKIFYLIIDILIASLFYIITILIFLGFVYINEGIVVGDRSHHTACVNFPQMFYFISFTSVFAFPYIITPSKIMSFIKSLISHYIKAFVIVLISLLLIHYFTYVHVYTLSDNRHFTFYVWSKIYNRHYLIKYLMTPLYMYSYWSCLSLLGHKDDIWKIIFGICIVAVTVPQKLLEFRYFILPYLIFRLNIKECSWLQLSAEMLLSIFINCTAVYLFVNKPFKWENSMEPQRFMW